MANFLRFNFTTGEFENSTAGPLGPFTQVGKGILGGTEGSRPAAGVADRVYIATDTNAIFIDNGTSWDTLFQGAADGGTYAETDNINIFTTTQRIHNTSAIELFDLYTPNNGTVNQRRWKFFIQDFAGDMALVLKPRDDAGANLSATLEYRFYHQGGVGIGDPTGGDQGAGTINATGYYVNGVLISESGSNSDGNWVRFADGTQIVWRRWRPSGACDAAYSVFGLSAFASNATKTWTFPQAFNAAPSVTGITERGDRDTFLVLRNAAVSTTLVSGLMAIVDTGLTDGFHPELNMAAIGVRP